MEWFSSTYTSDQEAEFVWC